MTTAKARSLSRVLRQLAVSVPQAQCRIDRAAQHSVSIVAADPIYSVAAADAHMGSAFPPNSVRLDEVVMSVSMEMRSMKRRRWSAGMFVRDAIVPGVRLIGPGFERQYGAAEQARQEITITVIQAPINLTDGEE